jgi:SPX domain protein involved in polyphosphate accumulation
VTKWDGKILRVFRNPHESVDFLLPSDKNIKVHVARDLVYIEDLSLERTVAMVIEFDEHPDNAG